MTQAVEDEGLRAVADLRPERLSRKVADAHTAAIPVLLAVGRREAETGLVSMRQEGKQAELLSLAEALARLRRHALRFT